MYNVKIDISSEHDSQNFIITGSINEVLNNKRLILSLKRLDYTISNNQISIPFRKETQINILKELQSLLRKFNFLDELSEKTVKEVISYDREEKSFEEFSNQARWIRNDEFENHPDLIIQFNLFQNALSKLLVRKLYPLQLLSSFHMAFAQNSCNFAVPGAGKTSIVYAAYAYLKSLPEDNEKHVDKLLVIGPLSSFAPWENEYKDCFGQITSFQRLSGSLNVSRNEKLEHLFSANPAEVTLIFHGGVSLLQNEIIDFLKRNKTMIVVDEAHRIKNHEGVWGRSITEISKEAVARIILTGTPVPNGYQDIYNLYKFIYPFKFKEILGFHYQNLEDMTYNSLPDSARILELKENLSPFFIRIKKEDLNLPPIVEETMSIRMGKHQREIYDFIESSYLETLPQDATATIKDVLNKAKLIRLRQASTNPLLLSRTLKESLESNIEGDYDPNSKFINEPEAFIDDSEYFNKICNYSDFETPQKFIEVLNILNKKIFSLKGKAIVWTIFIQNAKQLQDYLIQNSIQSQLLIGEVPQEEREIVIEKFNNPDNNEFQVIIANPFSVAESISLHKGCHNAIYLERDYNCSNFLQSKDRIHRVGLKENQITNYYYLVSKDSIDEVIDNRLLEKIKRMESIINDDIPLFTRVNDSDETDIIRDLIKNYAQRT